MSNTNYPTNLDTNPGDPTPTTLLSSPPHSFLHGFAQDAIIAIETYLGKVGSAVTNTITYLLTSTSSIDPGHKHTMGSINAGLLTLHNILVGGGAGANPTLIAPGSAGQVLTSNGPSADPSFQSGSTSQIFTSLTAGASLSAGIPVCALPFSSVFPTLDTNTSGTSASGTITKSFTVAANSNRGLIVAINLQASTSGDISTMTYAGASMTKILSIASGASAGNRLELWYLSAPATGTNNLVISFSTTTSCNYDIYSYYNVSQSGQPEVQNSATGNTSLATNNITPLTNGALIFGCANASPSGGMFANNTQSQASFPPLYCGDSGPIYPQSQQTGTATPSGNGGVLAIVLAPVMTSVTTRVYPTSTAQTTTDVGYVGIAQGTATVGNAVTVALNGVDINQTGLTIGAQYYLNDSPGTIGTSAGTNSRKAGIAITSTQLLITNIW